MVDDNSQTRVMRKPCRIVPVTKSVGNYWQPREGMNLWARPVCPMNEGMNFCAYPTHIKCGESHPCWRLGDGTGINKHFPWFVGLKNG